MRNHLHWTLLFVVGLSTAAGCDSDDSGPNVIEPVDMGVSGDQDARSIGRLPDSSHGTGGAEGADASGGGSSGGSAGGDADAAVGGQGGSGGSGPAMECSPGDRRCIAEGDPTYQYCRQDGQWAVEACSDGYVCADGSCMPDATGCTVGERVCLSGEQPGMCEPVGEWTRLEPCGESEVCVEGACQGRACAEAARNFSYLGCDYWAVELPNSALSEEGGTTADAPIGIVIANPSDDASVHVQVRGPNGQITALRDEVTVRVPRDIPEIQARYRDQTVRSQVRDGQGQIFADRLQNGDNLEIPPRGLATLLLPRTSLVEQSSSVRRQSFHIETDQPVAVYQFSPYCCNFSFSNDASILFPAATLGTDYYFLGVPTFPMDFAESSPAALVVVGTADNTEVNVDLPPGTEVLAPSGQRINRNGNRISATIGPHEVLLLQSGHPDPMTFPPVGPDLSGAHVTSSQPVALFSSHLCTFYPQMLSACDHVEEQLFPTGTWGSEFALVPTAQRGRQLQPTEVTYWKIIARDVGTQVELSVPFRDLRPLDPGAGGVRNCAEVLQNDGRTLVLGAGEFCEFGTQFPVGLRASAPLMVMGIISGQESTGIEMPFGNHAGDPAIFLVPPDRQYRRDYSFLTPDTYENDFVTVVADPESQLRLDDQPVDLRNATAVPGMERVFMHIPISDGPHRLSGDRAFGILVVAFDDFVSYAFTGGLNLTKR